MVQLVVQFHTRIIGKGSLPTAKHLQEFDYRYRGWLWEAAKLAYGVTESALYDYDLYTNHYERHNRRVVEYFRHRPQ
jgi:hypothetical protein